MGHGKLNVKMLEETLKQINIEMKINYNELQRLFNRAQFQLFELSNVSATMKRILFCILHYFFRLIRKWKKLSQI